MKCPKCKKELDEWVDECPYCKTNFEEKEDSTKEHAYWLNILAYVNIILSIVATIVVWIEFSTTEVVKEYNYITGTYKETIINWYGIIGGAGILLCGITMFLLLKTIIDIYYKLKSKR